MKTWLKSMLPLPAKLALKRLLKPFRREEKFPAWVFETPKLSIEGRVDFNEVERFLDSTAPPTRSPTAASTSAIKTSIVIPVFNKAEFTFQCLRSLIAEIDFNATEVIIVNNASSDETKQLLEYFRDFVEVLDNSENRGFVDACNQGAAHAQGKLLVFLNNDTVVLPGWLTELVETAERHDEIGVVGSLFLYPNGLVQEAGSIVWRSGEAFHYGWSRSPDDPRFVFARDVDYCSGASLLIRKDLFDQIGGFDRRYSPAYYEDADLCFAARAAGYRVVFQPASKIIHYEGATSGRDVNAGFKNYQITNQPKFYDKWKAVLHSEHFAFEKRNIEKAAHRLPGTAVVVFDDRIPTPDRDAGSGRMLLILRLLSRHYRTVFVYKAGHDLPKYQQLLWKEGIETVNLVDYPRLLKERKFHAAIVSRPELAGALLESIRKRARGIKIVFDMVDAYFLRFGLEYELTQDPQTQQDADKYRKIELASVRNSDVVWCNSSADKKAVAAEVPGKGIAVIPTIHELHSRGKSFVDRHDLLFIGNFSHKPNQDAVIFFIEDVLPLIRRTMPEVKLHLVGSNAGPEIQKYLTEGVCLHGYVPDIEPLFSSCRVFVAPLRFGAGVKGKIGDALSFGIPIVTTDVGASGMSFENGTHAMIANTPDEFASAVLRVYGERELWQRLSDSGYAHISRHFSPEVVEKIIVDSIA